MGAITVIRLLLNASCCLAYLQFIGAYVGHPKWAIITEFLHGGSLKAYLLRQQRRRLSVATVYSMALDIARYITPCTSRSFYLSLAVCGMSRNGQETYGGQWKGCGVTPQVYRGRS